MDNRVEASPKALAVNAGAGQYQYLIFNKTVKNGGNLKTVTGGAFGQNIKPPWTVRELVIR